MNYINSFRFGERLDDVLSNIYTLLLFIESGESEEEKKTKIRLHATDHMHKFRKHSALPTRTIKWNLQKKPDNRRGIPSEMFFFQQYLILSPFFC